MDPDEIQAASPPAPAARGLGAGDGAYWGLAIRARRPACHTTSRVRMEVRERVELAIAAAQETKAEDLLLVDMDSRSAITDYVLICSGRSQGHVRGISERIEEALRRAGYRHASLEGLQEGSWVLMDYDVLLVHVFHPETREYYDLESLLEGFPSERIGPQPPDPAPDDGEETSAA